MRVTIAPADLTDPEFAALVALHHAYCDGTAPPESCHRLPVEALAEPGVTVWAAHVDGALMGMGALKDLGPLGGEIKSMHTRAEARGKGLARAILDQILAAAREKAMPALWLETGVHPDFAAACALYESLGFRECPPFGDYLPDPHSKFYTLRLIQSEAAA